ncbi:MAG: hypothetical protein OXI22_12125 [Defluviicoccus sp.]|nr:hypothetical protein [Defluviicoccus sp.]MDE0384624.1 hypothetical protein [Defluviicoccus sp.]
MAGAEQEKARESAKATSYETAVDPGALIKIMMEVQSSIGELKGKVESLGNDVMSVQGRLRSLENKAWFVAGAIAVLVAVASILGWLLSPFVQAFATKLAG